MNGQLVGIAITAIVGIAGILSTHLLARAQRKGEQERLKAERRDRYRFTEFETQSKLYADLVAELRTLLVAIQLRIRVTGQYRRKWVDGRLAEKARNDAAVMGDTDLARQLNEFADHLDSDPSFAFRMAREQEGDLPPAIDTMSVIRRVTELGARIQIVGGSHGTAAARSAERAVSVTLLSLQATDLRDFRDEISLEELEQAIDTLEEAAIYELRLLPYGEKKSLEELRKIALSERIEADLA